MATLRPFSIELDEDKVTALTSISKNLAKTTCSVLIDSILDHFIKGMKDGNIWIEPKVSYNFTIEWNADFHDGRENDE